MRQMRIPKWLPNVLCSLALAGSVSQGLSQTVNDYVVEQFTNGLGSWAGNYGNAPYVFTWDPTENRGPGASPGALKGVIDFNLCSNNIQRDFEGSIADTLDLTTYTKLHFSVKVDPSSSHLSDWGGGAFGNIRPHVRLASWGGDVNVSSPDSQWVGANAYGAWQDYTMTIDQTAGLGTKVAAKILGMDIWSGWGTCATPIGHTNTVTFWIDNIWFEKNLNPYVPPPTNNLRKAGPSGVEISMTDNANQWQRDAISSPAGTGVLWAEAGGAPVTYSFTIAAFPDPIAHEGFEAHLFLVNGDTVSAGDQTYGGCDWNSRDIAVVSISSNTNGGGSYFCQFQWKTNLPNSNPPDDALHRPGSLTSSNILGTWSVTFTDNTNVTMSGPGGISTNFTIPDEAVLNNFSPATSFLQYGFHKNDNENDGHNNGVSGTFSRVQKTGGSFVYDDLFNGTSLTSNYPWRRTSANAVQHVAPGTAWFLEWTLPAAGFTPESAPAVTGPWNFANITNIWDGSGKRHGAVLSSVLPGVNQNYFRLIKRPFTKLQVLLPGESNAPNTVSGKTGTPLDQTAGVPFSITVNACDAVWNVVNSADTIAITSSDGGATLPPNAALAGGTQTFIVTLNSGDWTITATDVTDGTKTPNTSSTVHVP